MNPNAMTIRIVGNHETARAGYGGHAAAGYCGVAIVGDWGDAIVGEGGTAIAGKGGHALAGDAGRAIVGRGGLAFVGDGGFAGGDERADLNFYFQGHEISVIVAAEGPVRPGIMYRLDADGRFVEAGVVADYVPDEDEE
jgi:hypothetical protein